MKLKICNLSLATAIFASFAEIGVAQISTVTITESTSFGGDSPFPVELNVNPAHNTNIEVNFYGQQFVTTTSTFNGGVSTFSGQYSPSGGMQWISQGPATINSGVVNIDASVSMYPSSVTVNGGIFNILGTVGYPGGTFAPVQVSGAGTINVSGSGNIWGNLIIQNGGRINNSGTLFQVTAASGGVLVNNGDIGSVNAMLVYPFGNKNQFGSGGKVYNYGRIATITVDQGGVVVNNGIIGLIAALPGSYVSGIGAVGMASFYGSSSLAPGNSIGTFTVTNNVIFYPQAIYLAEVNGRGDADMHIVGGMATIDGAIVDVRPYQGGVFGKSSTYSILTANGGVIGRFGQVVDSFAFLDPSLSYTSNNVNLTLTRNQTSFSSLAQTSNQVAVARVLDIAEQTGQASNLIGTLYGLSETEARSAYTSLSGESLADIRGAATSGVNLFLGTVRDQAVLGGAKTTSPIQGLKSWANMIGGNLQLSSQGGYAGTLTQAWGGVGGFEKQFSPSLKAGVAIGGTSSNIAVSGMQTSGQVNFGHAALYGQKDLGKAYILAAAGWSAGHSSTTRTSSLLGGLQTGSFDGQGPNGRIELGYRIPWGQIEITPYAAIQGAWIRQNGLSESGDPIGSLFVKGQTVSSVPGSLGVQMRTMFDLQTDWQLALRGRAAYVHDFTPSRSITAQVSGIAQGFTASGLPMPANAADLGAGFELINKNGFSASLNADALLGKDAIGWKGQAALTFVW